MGKQHLPVDCLWTDGTRTAPRVRMKRLRTLLHDPRLWRIASLLVTVILVACQENDGGGGGGVDPGY